MQSYIQFSEAIAQFGLLYLAVCAVHSDNTASVTLDGQCFGQCGPILLEFRKVQYNALCC